VANDPDCGPWGPSQNKRITLADPDCVADVSFRERTCTKNGVEKKREKLNTTNIHEKARKI
jgi:hypothetical protein